MVVYRIPYIDIGLERGRSHSWIEIQNIRGLVSRAEVRVYPVDKGGFARTGHADGDYHYRFFLVFLLFRRHRRSRQVVVYYLIFVRSTT